MFLNKSVTKNQIKKKVIGERAINTVIKIIGGIYTVELEDKSIVENIFHVKKLGISS